MKTRYRIFTAAVIAGLMIVSASQTQARDVVDHSLFSDLLQSYVKDGLVNYQEMKSEEQKLDRYLALLDSTNPDNLGREEQFAFYMNAYNAYTIKLILENYPVKSIKDTGKLLKSPWKIDFVKIGGQTMTLDDVEHNILRPRFKDARVHFAINCAAKDCPPLYPEAFEGSKVDEQLERNARAFLNNPEKNYLDGETLYVTRLFKWFGGDFNDDPLGYILQFAEGDFKAQLEAKKDKIKVKFLDYDWALNGI
jgi:hypothetical protein